MSKKIALLAALLVVATPGGDPPESTARIAVHGDLAHARHVAVVVPGSDVDDRRFDATVARMAAAIYTEAVHTGAVHTGAGGTGAGGTGAGRDDLAVVAWLGYRTPSGLGVDAASGRLARAGARALAEYVRTLPGHVHLLCHSYGSVVCALSGAEVDDVVFVGSPGVRVSSAAALPAGRVWAARGARDWVRWVPAVRVGDLGHGSDPVEPAFGARVFDAGDAEHDGYFRGAPLRAMARISVGGTL